MCLFVNLYLKFILVNLYPTYIFYTSIKMLVEILELIGTLVVILVGCELFANAVEHVGRRFSLSHAAAGSLLAAVGTAMPETLVVIIALLIGGGHAEEIGMGAILGPPFMLLTLAIFWVALTVIILKFKKKRENFVLNVHVPALAFDLKYFIIAFAIVIASALFYNQFHDKSINYIAAIMLLLIYIYYVKVTLSIKPNNDETYEEFFYLTKYFSVKSTITNVYLQLLLGFIIIFFGAKLFIGYLVVIGTESGISLLVLSLLITPIATELPEKYNSIMWVIKKKDTLGIANITGAAIFQSTILVAIGLIFTSWELDFNTIINISFAFISGILLYLSLKLKGKLYATHMLIGGVLYILYILLVLGFIKI